MKTQKPQNIGSNARITLIMLAVLSSATAGAASPCPADLGKYNVVWDSPSHDSLGSMPVGNGDIGANVWVEPSGDLVLLLSKTDAWSENGRLLKLGRVRIQTDPPIYQPGATFRQELDLRAGVIRVRNQESGFRCQVWIDANQPVVRVEMEQDEPTKVTVRHETWRTKRRQLKGMELFSAYGQTDGTLPARFQTQEPLMVEPDTILDDQENRIVFFHRNERSIWDKNLRLQVLDDLADPVNDPIMHRTFGAIIRAPGLISDGKDRLVSKIPGKNCVISIYPLTARTPTADAWVTQVGKGIAAIESQPLAKARTAHAAWWNAFWTRSWIFAEESVPPGLPVNDHSWRVGVDSKGGNRFGGTIAGPRVVGMVLSNEDIAELAKKDRPDQSDLTDLSNTPLTTGCTVTAWIKPSPRESGRILDKSTASTADGLLLDTHPGLSLRWIVGKDILTQANCLKPGVWQHVAASVDTGGVQRIYLDGKLIKESSRSGETDAEVITRGYNLQRWINACAGRGGSPIKFNGTIFNVDGAQPIKNLRYDADYRDWGGCYWFQNTRLPYWSMLDAGDFDLMQPLFKMFMDALPLRKLATQKYYQHDGAFYPETMYFWGAYNNNNYGWHREGKPDGLTDNPHIKYYWQGGLELTAMMLRCYDYTQDQDFLTNTVLPFAHEIVTFYDQHYMKGDDGKLFISPAYALEDIWECSNPTPEIAGLKANLSALISLSQDEDKVAQYKRQLAELPDFPTIKGPDGKTRILPCLPGWKHRKWNSEKPELYNVFPHLLYGVGRPDLDVARESWKYSHKTYGKMKPGGWSQDPIFLACLGLTDEAKAEIIWRSKLKFPAARFPAFWTPGFDWMPDQDHGGVFMTALQKMVMQSDLPANSRKIFLLPAWPKEWNVSFKLHAPQNTTIEGIYRNGRMMQLKVTPESRRKNILFQKQ